MKQPKTGKKGAVFLKECSHCGTMKSSEDFIKVNNWFYADSLSPVCNSCIKDFLISKEWNWRDVDKLCQTLNLPFIPQEFERLHEINEDNVFPIYATIFFFFFYEGIDWADYFKKYSDLKELKLLEDELPLIHEQKFNKLREKWGMNYDDEDLIYLDNLYNGLLATQNVNGALQVDQALKICKISLQIDKKIRAGEDFDKIMSSYDKMVKTAEFTPKNAKNENDFDSFGEVFAWLEKRGWVNTYYDDVPKDIADEVIQNLQSFNQKLYINEPGIGETITSRIEALKVAQELEDNSVTDMTFDLEKYDQDGYDSLMQEELILDDNEDLDIDTRGI